MTLVVLIFTLSGLFTLALGMVHFAMPFLFDFDGAIPIEGRGLRPLRVGPIRYQTQRRDVRGIVYVMNNAVSFTLVSIGAAELMAARWLDAPFARWAALWIAGWWFLRAGSQLYLGRRRGDWLLVAGFASLGIVHMAGALAL